MFLILDVMFIIWPLLGKENKNLKRLAWGYYPASPTVLFTSNCNVGWPKTLIDLKKLE
jgi:hypothetical protein